MSGGNASRVAAATLFKRALVALVVLGLLGLTGGASYALGSLFVGQQAVYLAGVVVLAIVAASVALGSGSAALRIGLYLSSIALVTVLFAGVVWALVFVLVALAFGAGTGVTAASVAALGIEGVAAVGLLAAVVDAEEGTDWGLRLRMAAAIALLGLFTALFLSAAWGLTFLVTVFLLPPVVGAYLALAVVLVLFGVVVSAEAGQVTAIERRTDASVVGPAEFPELHDRVTRIAAQLDVPVPAIAVARNGAPEAMVVGFRPSSMHLVVSTGLVESLDDDELDAVIAHELAHVANRDAMVMTALSVPVVVVDGIRGRLLAGIGMDDRPEKPTRGEQLSKDELWGEDEEWRLSEPSVLDDRRVSTVGWVLATAGFWLGLVAAGGDDDSDGPSIPFLAAGFALVLIVSWLASRLVVAVLSRARETAADRTAAEVTGSPTALATALRSLDDRIEATPGEDLRDAAGVSALSILPLDRGGAMAYRDYDTPRTIERLQQRLFGTHPPTERRIERLERLAVEQSR